MFIGYAIFASICVILMNIVFVYIIYLMNRMGQGLGMIRLLVFTLMVAFDLVLLILSGKVLSIVWA
jgi:hypothetical protein